MLHIFDFVGYLFMAVTHGPERSGIIAKLSFEKANLGVDEASVQAGPVSSEFERNS